MAFDALRQRLLSRIPIDSQVEHAGQGLVLFLFSATVLATLALGLGLSLSPVVSCLVLAASVTTGLWVAFRTGRNVVALVALCLCLLALPLCHAIWDLTSDGQEYQFDAAYALAHGWNPFYRAFADFLPSGGTALPWPQHYPMGPWLIAALAWSVGASAETTKFELPVLMVAVPLACYPALRRFGFGTLAAAGLALVAAFDPIIVTQIFTRYSDGILGALVTMFLAFGTMAIVSGDRLRAACALGCLALAIDTKFSALPIFAAMAGGLCLVAWMACGPKTAIAAATATGLTTAIALLTLGWHPYVNNVAEHANPFYPAIGRDSIDIIAPFEPGGLIGRLRIVALGKSLMAPTGSWEVDDNEVVFRKTPFTVTRAEWKASGEVDSILGGFGPLFSGALLVGAIGAAAALATRPRLNSTAPLSLLLTVAAFGSAAVMPANWWARYVPQLWPGVLLMALAALSVRSRLAHAAGWLCIAALAANAGLVTTATASLRSKRQAEVEHNLVLAKADGSGFCAAFGAAHARINLMREQAIRVYPLPQKYPLICKGVRSIPYAWDALGNDAQSCPCSEIAHDPTGRWIAPPDNTRAVYLQLIKDRF